MATENKLRPEQRHPSGPREMTEEAAERRISTANTKIGDEFKNNAQKAQAGSVRGPNSNDNKELNAAATAANNSERAAMNRSAQAEKDMAQLKQAQQLAANQAALQKEAAGKQRQDHHAAAATAAVAAQAVVEKAKAAGASISATITPSTPALNLNPVNAQQEIEAAKAAEAAKTSDEALKQQFKETQNLVDEASEQRDKMQDALKEAEKAAENNPTQDQQIELQKTRGKSAFAEAAFIAAQRKHQEQAEELAKRGIEPDAHSVENSETTAERLATTNDSLSVDQTQLDTSDLLQQTQHSTPPRPEPSADGQAAENNDENTHTFTEANDTRRKPNPGQEWVANALLDKELDKDRELTPEDDKVTGAGESADLDTSEGANPGQGEDGDNEAAQKEKPEDTKAKAVANLAAKMNNGGKPIPMGSRRDVDEDFKKAMKAAAEAVKRKQQEMQEQQEKQDKNNKNTPLKTALTVGAATGG